jgi:hypothetical protein
MLRGRFAWSPSSGTTDKWAVLQGRRFVGWEIHRPYWLWAQRRLFDARTERLKALRAR